VNRSRIQSLSLPIRAASFNFDEIQLSLIRCKAVCRDYEPEVLPLSVVRWVIERKAGHPG